jgi:alanyl-tRNA synthetase
VRVVEVPGFSKELCGGTHVDRTGDIGLFKITSETALAAGVRRIEAVTGEEALRYIQTQGDRLHNLQNMMKTSPDDLGTKVKQLLEQRRELERQLKQASRLQSKDLVSELAGLAEDLEGVKVVARRVAEIGDMNQLKDLAVAIKHHLKSSVVVLYIVVNNKPQVVVAVTDDQKERIPAGGIAREIGQMLGGSGGGTPIMATAGGDKVSAIDAAVAATPKVIMKELGKSGE